MSIKQLQEVPPRSIPRRSGQSQPLNLTPERRMLISMPMTLDQIVEETSQLPSDVLAELIDRILLAQHGGIGPDVESAWRTEVGRRIQEIEAGKVEGISLEESLARMRKIAGL